MPTYPEWVTNNKYIIQIFISEYHILYHRTTACIENKMVNYNHKLPLSNDPNRVNDLPKLIPIIKN